MIIVGAGGHAREIFMLLDKEIRANTFFFDNVSADVPSEIGGSPVLRTEDEARLRLREDARFLLGTGRPVVRKNLYHLFQSWGGEPYSFQAQTAVVGDFETLIGEGANIMHDVFISTNVRMGKGCLVNTRAQLHHDVSIGDFCEIAPAAILLGSIKIGNEAFIGTGSILLPGVEIGDGTVIGAGAVVTKNVVAGRTVKGVPAI